MANGVDNHNGGITLNGLMTLYNTLGSEATAKDLAKLGIRVGPLLYPRRALEHAAERLVEARKKLQNAKVDSDTLTQSLNQERIMSNELKNECERYRKQYDEGMTQVEMMNINLSKAMSELENERSGRAYAENKVIRLEKELQNVKEACKDMHNLLKLKINEKETFQRALWSVEQKAEQMRNISIKTKGKMFDSLVFLLNVFFHRLFFDVIPYSLSLILVVYVFLQTFYLLF
jgi:DNA-directed RNA polymerase subunit L